MNLTDSLTYVDFFDAVVDPPLRVSMRRGLAHQPPSEEVHVTLWVYSVYNLFNLYIYISPGTSVVNSMQPDCSATNLCPTPVPVS